jgi:hypothetical protein
MEQNDYIVSIEGVINRKAFFAELLSFYAKQDVILTIWGKLPSHILKSLDQFKSPSSRIRGLFFKESNWFLNSHSLNNLTQHLCEDSLLENLTWGLIKADIPLGLCRSWDDMNLDGSDLIDETKLFLWLDHLRVKELIQSYEKIRD